MGVRGEIRILVEKQDVVFFLQSHNETQSVFWEQASISFHHLSFQISLGNEDILCFLIRNTNYHRDQDFNNAKVHSDFLLYKRQILLHLLALHRESNQPGGRWCSKHSENITGAKRNIAEPREGATAERHPCTTLGSHSTY